jgi:hypothetical protein
VADRAAVLHTPVSSGADHLAVDHEGGPDRDSAFVTSEARLLDRDLQEALVVHSLLLLAQARRYGLRYAPG